VTAWQVGKGREYSGLSGIVEHRSGATLVLLRFAHLSCEFLRTGSQEDQSTDEFRGLSSCPFRLLQTRRDGRDVQHVPLEIDMLRSNIGNADPEMVTLKQLKGWGRVLVTQRLKKKDVDRRVGYPSYEHQAGAPFEHGLLGNVPARRFGIPHWDSKFAGKCEEQRRSGKDPTPLSDHTSVHMGSLRTRLYLCMLQCYSVVVGARQRGAPRRSCCAPSG